MTNGTERRRRNAQRASIAPLDPAQAANRRSKCSQSLSISLALRVHLAALGTQTPALSPLHLDRNSCRGASMPLRSWLKGPSAPPVALSRPGDQP
jgi:hypothetical protein